MLESYLQYIWSTKNVPFHHLTTVLNETIEVQNSGILNYHSGPDFFNGRVKINGITWAGNIEIHVKSSDWYKHGHETDAAYNNVILHVVHEYDKPVYIHGKELPTIELKDYIQTTHYQQYKNFIQSNSNFNCAQQIHFIPSLFIIQQIENSTVERLERKATEISLRFDQLKQDKFQLIYECLTVAFGIKINFQPFFELTRIVPIQQLIQHTEERNLITLLGSAGLIDKTSPFYSEWLFIRHKYCITPLHPSIWKYKGIRPPSYPEKRISELAKFIDSSFFKHDLFQLTLFDLKFIIEQSTSFLTREMKNRLIINGIVPLLWWNGKNTNSNEHKIIALQLLSDLPPEENGIIKAWRNIKIFSKNALDSQGLLETKNNYCSKNNCLKCKIGQEILKK